jgi:hypothetical protein
MKTTDYFQERRKEPDREWIEDEWIERVLLSPEHEEVQSNGRIRRRGRIVEANNRVLHVVVLEDGETVHNAFFDRRFKLLKT